MSDYKKYTGEDIVRDFVRMRVEDLERIMMIYKNISSFVSEAEKMFSRIEKLIDLIECLPVKSGVIVADPMKRFLSYLRIEIMGGDENPYTIYLSMSPPLLPHFFLVVSYITVKMKFIPLMIIRSSPIVSLSSILAKVGLVSAPVAHFLISVRLLEQVARFEISVHPLDTKYIKLPLKPKKNVLYLCELGLSTAPVSDSYNVEIDISDISPISNDDLNNKDFISLKNVLDDMVGGLS
ncbi:MAG: hypothetical protein QXK54_04490 [Ignisphaera sp.]|uniref:Uncharacterized protein n=1 Tax=Ignisphaera aggregans TaxID=334771 RepID=A0A7C4D276_9CREN